MLQTLLPYNFHFIEGHIFHDQRALRLLQCLHYRQRPIIYVLAPPLFPLRCHFAVLNVWSIKHTVSCWGVRNAIKVGGQLMIMWSPTHWTTPPHHAGFMKRHAHKYTPSITCVCKGMSNYRCNKKKKSWTNICFFFANSRFKTKWWVVQQKGKSHLVNAKQVGRHPPSHVYCRKHYGSMAADRLCIMHFHTQTPSQGMYHMQYTNTVNALCELFRAGKHSAALRMREQIQRERKKQKMTPTIRLQHSF